MDFFAKYIFERLNRNMNNQDPFDQADDKAAFLLEKWQHWTSENRISQFYNNLITLDNESPAVEILDNGYILVSNKSIEYTNLTTGNISRIIDDWSGYDILAITRLHELSQQMNTFRVDRLVSNKRLNFKNINCLYAEYESPNAQYGQSISEKMLVSEIATWTIDHDMLAYRTLIEQFKILLDAARQVSYDIGCGLPINLLDPSIAFTDSVGIFFSGLYKWDTKEETVVNLGLEFLNWGTALSTNISDPVNEGKKEEILNYAESLWKQI